MCEVNSAYKKTVMYEKGVKVLYVLVLRSIYGCIMAALLWYDLYTSVLKQMGFELNRYDNCVANKIIDGKQCTILWHVDDNKISHVNPEVVTDIITRLEKHFGKFTVTRGRNHEYLGMDVNIRDDRKVEVDMIKQIQKLIDDFSVKIEGKVSTPASDDLYVQIPGDKTLEKELSEEFHSVTQKLLFIIRRGR